MNKHLILLLLITSSAFTHGMEKESPLDHLSKIMPPKKSKKERPLLQLSLPFIKLTEHPTSQSITAMRENKDNFEEMLNKDKKIKRCLKKQGDLRKIFSIVNNDLGNTGFACASGFSTYCYYQKLHTQINLNLSDIQNLDMCKGCYMCGCSALGAAMLAQDVSTEKKRAFIQELIHYGFKPREADLELADLIVYENTIPYQTILLHLAYTKTLATWSTLPQEVRVYITEYLLQLLNKESLLLPDFDWNSYHKIKMPQLLCKFAIQAHMQLPFSSKHNPK